MASQSKTSMAEHRGVVFSVLSVQWPNGWVIRSVTIDSLGLPAMRDDDSLFDTEEESFKAGSRMARDAIDAVLGK
jgi:hypothetical protein